MKTLAAFGISTLLLGAPAAVAGPHDETIVEVAAGNDSFDTLVRAIKQAELVHTLENKGPFTVFAPTDSAFNALPDETLEALLRDRNRDRLAAILSYHVVSGELTADKIASKTTLTTVNGQRLSVERRGDSIFINDTRVVQANVGASNGVIHAIDGVLLPTTANIVEIANSAGQFGALLAAADAAGLVATLRADGPITVLAPTDAAFHRLGQNAVESLLEPRNREQLKNILTYHVLKGRVYAEEALAAGRARTVQGESVRFNIRDGELYVNDSRVLGNDIEASNGVIHVINSVLIPKKKVETRPKGRLVLGIFTERPSRALAAQLGVDRDETLVITGVVDGSNADEFGLREFDLLLEIEGHPATADNIARAKREVGFNNKVELVVLRNGEKKTIKVPVGVERN